MLLVNASLKINPSTKICAFKNGVPVNDVAVASRNNKIESLFVCTDAENGSAVMTWLNPSSAVRKRIVALVALPVTRYSTM